MSFSHIVIYLIILALLVLPLVVLFVGVRWALRKFNTRS